MNGRRTTTVVVDGRKKKKVEKNGGERRLRLREGRRRKQKEEEESAQVPRTKPVKLPTVCLKKTPRLWNTVCNGETVIHRGVRRSV